MLSGNNNDKKTFPAMLQAYYRHLKAEEQPHLVMDSAVYFKETLETAREVHWLMRVPETLAQAKKRVLETPQEEMIELEKGYFGCEGACDYAGIPQRWLVVFSEAAY